MHMSMCVAGKAGRDRQSPRQARAMQAGIMSPYPHWRKGTKGLALPSEAMCGLLRGKPHAVRWPRKMHRKCGVGLQQCETALAVSSQCGQAKVAGVVVLRPC